MYSFFGLSLIGQQYLDTGQQYPGYEEDWFVPGFTILQFLFYMGWLKVTSSLCKTFKNLIYTFLEKLTKKIRLYMKIRTCGLDRPSKKVKDITKLIKYI